MKTYEIEAYTPEEAKRKVYELYNAIVIRDYTKSWNAVKVRNSNPVSFLIEKMLEDDIFSEPDAAALVQITSRHNAKRFYKPFKSKRQGNIKVKRTVEVRGVDSDKLYGVCSGKTEGITFAKEIIGQVRENLYGKVVYQPDRYEFILEYCPPKKAKLGKYIIIKSEKDDLISVPRKYEEMW